MSHSTEPKISEILRRLMFQKNLKTVDLARATQLPQPTVQRIVSGGCSRKPHRSSLEPIAKYFSISVEQLLGEKPLSLLDNATYQDLENIGVHRVPLLAWSEVMNYLPSKNKLSDSPNSTTPQLLTESLVSPSAFALTIQDASMEPLFTPGTQVIFDPDKVLRDRCYILVKMETSAEPIFRQLILDGSDRFIKPLSPDLERFRMQMLSEQDHILGML